MKTKKELPKESYKQRHYDTQNQIMQALKMGQVKRAELRRLTRTSDIELREAIRELQMQGQPIVNLTDGKGYKFAESKEELERYKLQERSRAFYILTKLDKMRWDDGEQEALDV